MMGWTFYTDNAAASRADMIRREFTQELTAERMGFGFEDIAERGSTVYAIMWRQSPGAQRVYFGMVFLTTRRGGEFGYKDIGEDMGPNESRAPKRMIRRLEALAPAPNDYARQWRNRCLGV